MKKVLCLFIPTIAACLMIVITFYLVTASSRVLAAPLSFTTKGEILVNTLEDELNSDGDCSLREAIQAANTNLPVDACGSGDVLTDTITFNVAGTINSGFSVMAGGPLVIDGGNVITTSGDGIRRVWWVQEGELTLKSLAIVDGGPDSGAGLYKHSGNLSVIDCIFSNNNANQQGIGGGINNMQGPLIVTDSIFDGNRSQNPGGGIFNSGTMTITNSTFSGNISDYWGGGIYNSGSLFISKSIFSGNHAAYAGGGIYNANTIIINSTVFSGNTSNGEGGGIYNANNQATIIDATLLGNTAEYFGGGISNHDMLNVNDSTFTENSSVYGGAIFNGNDIDYSVATIINSTLSGNNAMYGAGICDGIYYGHEYYGTITVTNSTLSNNNASSEGGGIYNYPNLGMTALGNSIVTHSIHGGNCGGHPITDIGHNIEDQDFCGFDPANGSLPNTDPMLGPLQDNGGPTWTHALLLGSPAIDAGDNAYCPTIDQRGVTRPLDGDGDGIAVCDIGSFERIFQLMSVYLPLVIKYP